MRTGIFDAPFFQNEIGDDPGSPSVDGAVFLKYGVIGGFCRMQTEAVPCREAVVRIAPESNTGQTLQNFCRLDKKETLNHSLLAVAFKTISPQTWESINDFFALCMKKTKKINVDHIRTDTIVVETNIHCPTDSSLLWDTYRTIDRLWTKALDLGFGFLFPAPNSKRCRFHPEKIRDLHLDITRFVTSKDRQRKISVKNSYKTLIERTSEAVTKAKRIAAILTASGNAIAALIGAELSSFFTAMDKVVDAAQRRYDGEKVPVEDKVFRDLPSGHYRTFIALGRFSTTNRAARYRRPPRTSSLIPS